MLERIRQPADLRTLDPDELAVLASEVRDLIVRTVARTGGHLGPNLGAVELTIALHRVFDSPSEPILFDVGHQAYPHKILTGRADDFAALRQTGGLSGYPNRDESPHDWIENSHASTALSYADGIAKAFALRGERRPVVAVVGDGALTGGMCWEALNNIAAANRPVIVVVNDNGRSYAPTIGGVGRRLGALRLRPGYEQVLGHGKRLLRGTAVYDVLHGVKRGLKDLLAPQGMFEDLGMKYLGPVDGHDVAGLEAALRLARGFGGPVIVHAVTRKGYGYAPAENDQVDQMHQSPPFDAATGRALPRAGKRWTEVFGEELVAAGEQRDDIVAVTAAMCRPTGLAAFGERFPQRCFDVGIAEQHAVTSAAGLAMAGMHPVVAVYATFLNRAFDQVLLDVALHRLPVTFVLDRAGLTGDDGPSHNGMWDLAILGAVPGLRIAAPRDEATLREEFREAIAAKDGPTVVRFPKTVLPDPIRSLRRVGGTDVLFEPDENGPVDVLVVALGATAHDALGAARTATSAGYSVRVVDPRWVQPVDPALNDLARRARLVVTVEDGVASGGAGARIAQALTGAAAVRAVSLGVPTRFLHHGAVADVRAAAGVTEADLARRIVEECAAGAEFSPARASRAGSA